MKAVIPSDILLITCGFIRNPNQIPDSIHKCDCDVARNRSVAVGGARLCRSSFDEPHGSDIYALRLVEDDTTALRYHSRVPKALNLPLAPERFVEKLRGRNEQQRADYRV
jgi:hypothetical protein